MRARSVAIAVALFWCWLRSLSHRTMMPVGTCFTWKALAVTLRCCPPAPEPRQVDHSSSRSSRTTCASVGSGRTATVTVLVWTRPRFSLGGMRCQRWPPGSSLNVSQAPLPVTRKTRKPDRCSTTSRSKTPPHSELRVDRELLLDQELRVISTLGRSDFHDAAHGVLLKRLRP